jgi:hypothetical protein
MKTIFIIITGISIIIWLVAFKPDSAVHLLLVPAGILLVSYSLLDIKLFKKGGKSDIAHKQKY